MELRRMWTDHEFPIKLLWYTALEPGAGEHFIVLQECIVHDLFGEDSENAKRAGGRLILFEMIATYCRPFTESEHEDSRREALV